MTATPRSLYPIVQQRIIWRGPDSGVTLTSGSSTAVAIQEGVVLDYASTASFSFTEHSPLNAQTHPSGINITTLSALIPSITTPPSHNHTTKSYPHLVNQREYPRPQPFSSFRIIHRRLHLIPRADLFRYTSHRPTFSTEFIHFANAGHVPIRQSFSYEYLHLTPCREGGMWSRSTL